jgi:hypothetical protein
MRFTVMKNFKYIRKLTHNNNDSEVSTDSSIGHEMSTEFELYIYADKKINKYLVKVFGKDIIDVDQQKILIDLTQSYILDDTLEIKIINNYKYYRFTLYNNVKLIDVVSRTKRITKGLDAKN